MLPESVRAAAFWDGLAQSIRDKIDASLNRLLDECYILDPLTKADLASTDKTRLTLGYRDGQRYCALRTLHCPTKHMSVIVKFGWPEFLQMLEAHGESRLLLRFWPKEQVAFFNATDEDIIEERVETYFLEPGLDYPVR